MLDKLITYIVWWYKTVYHVLSVAWTNRITTRPRSDTGSHNRFDLIHIDSYFVVSELSEFSNRGN
jgi:hypothetical protein